MQRYIHEKLREAASKGNCGDLNYILNQSEFKIDVNDPDPISGRTAIHMAANSNKVDALSLLIAKHGNMNAKDKEGYSVIELSLNRHEFIPFNADADVAHRKFILSEANTKLKANQTTIMYIEDIADINSIIDAHPKMPRIGFIINVPRIMKQFRNDIHVMTVYFERNKNTETFIFIDSALGCFYPLPKSSNNKIHREIIFNPFPRQHSKIGCFEDGVKILSTLLLRNGFVTFCKQNSTNLTSEFATVLSATEKQRQARLTMMQVDSKTNLSLQEFKELSRLSMRSNVYKSNCLFKFNQLSPVTAIYELTSLPMRLLPYIERFDTMRYFRIHHSEQFLKPISSSENCLSYILRHGTIRNAKSKNSVDAKSESAIKDIKDHLTNPDKQFDFSGRSFEARHQSARLFRKSRKGMLACYFFSKIYQQCGLVSIRENRDIIKRILTFSTG